MMDFKCVDEIVRYNKEKGYHFFCKDSMQFFASKVYDPVYLGCVFVTSEQDRSPFGHAAWDGQRRYTVRAIREDGTIAQVSEFGEYDSLPKARRAAGKMSETDLIGKVNA